MAKSRGPTPVLDAADYDLIVATLEQLDQVPGVIAKSERCGVACEEYARNHEWNVNALKTILKEWFPRGRPR